MSKAQFITIIALIAGLAALVFIMNKPKKCGCKHSDAPVAELETE